MLPVSKECKTFKFKTAQEAWEGLNEYLATQEKEIYSRGGGRYGPTIKSFDNLIFIKRPQIDPEFDFGNVLNYTKQKWTSLLKNYVDLTYVELVKSEVAIREKKGSKSYDYAFHFTNLHSSGKDCLISMIFTRRLNKERPQVYFITRISEITKRFIFDLLLVQRIAEYVYGPGKKWELIIFLPAMYISAEHFLYYTIHKPIEEIYQKGRRGGKFAKRIRKVHKRFLKKDLSSVTFKSDYKVISNLQRHASGGVAKNRLLAKDLVLIQREDFPEDCISPKERLRYKRLNK